MIEIEGHSHNWGGWRVSRSLPLRPIFPGFLINTLFYAVIAYLLLFAWRDVRRVMRSRRGCCGKCGYPVGESAVCTECGAGVKRYG